MPFQSTRWSLILQVREAEEPAARRAMEELLRIYWQPIYAYVRSRGSNPEDASDLTQEFIAHLLAQNLIHKFDLSHGRFRPYLLTALKNFLADQHRRAHARKRRGDVTAEPLNFDRMEKHFSGLSSRRQSAEEIYDRQWVLSLLERARERLRRQYVEAGKKDRFDALSPFITLDGAGPPYIELSQTLGISVEALKVAVHRLRKSYGKMIREEVSDTLAEGQVVEDELRELMNVFR